MPSIDTSFQRSPTGAAASLAAAHSAPHPLKLYGGWFCPFVQRAWIVLAEKSIPHQYIEIDPYDKTPALLALNPRGLVPTLAVPPSQTGRDAQAPLYESGVVCEYLEEAYGDRGERLLPSVEEPYARARCRLWMDHVATRMVPAFYTLLQRDQGDVEGLRRAREALHRHVKTFAGAMAPREEGPWFLGEKFSLVDVMFAPWAKRLWLIDHYKPGGCGFPKKGERGEDESVWERWETWFAAVVERVSVKSTWSEDEMYIKAYKRYADDTTQSEVGKATREGRSLP